MTSRARSVAHAEYEILNSYWKVNLIDLKNQMSPEGDEVAEKRMTTAMSNVSKYLKNMKDRRMHKLPKDHSEYRGKDE